MLVLDEMCRCSGSVFGQTCVTFLGQANLSREAKSIVRRYDGVRTRAPGNRLIILTSNDRRAAAAVARMGSGRRPGPVASKAERISLPWLQGGAWRTGLPVREPRANTADGAGSCVNALAPSAPQSHTQRLVHVSE